MSPRVRRAVAAILGKPMRQSQLMVTLWGKPDCSLCDHAHAVLDKLSREYPLTVTVKSILADEDAFHRYRYLIPVVEIEGGQRFEGKITELWLRRGLDDVLLPR